MKDGKPKLVKPTHCWLPTYNGGTEPFLLPKKGASPKRSKLC